MERGIALVKAVARDRVLIGQVIRYGITGGGVTLVGVTTYWLLAKSPYISEQIANILSWFVSVALGYCVHSSWSFKGHGSRSDPLRIRFRFFATALVGLALNALWVFILVNRMHGPEWWPMPLMAFATPLVIFPLNRRWVFG